MSEVLEALPTAEEAQAGTQPELPATQVEGEKPEGEQAEKPPKTPEQRALEKAQRVIDRRTRQREELRAEVMQLRQQVELRRQPNADTTTSDDDAPVTLTRKQIDALITERAQKLAPQIKHVEDIEVQRRTTAQRMAKELGTEKFEAATSDLDEAMGGMTDSQGNLKPAIEAIFESETPTALLEYLSDPDNADEAESLGSMSALKAGRAIAQLELKLKSEAQASKAKAKPQRSDAPEPLEMLKGSGQPASAPSDTDSVDVWLKKERARLDAKRKVK